MLDEHDDFVTELAARVELLISVCGAASDSLPRKITSRRLSHSRKTLSSISETVMSRDRAADPCLLHKLQEQLSDIKKELTDIRNSLPTP